MAFLPDIVSEAVHVTFAIFARKLILCGEIIAIIGMTSWRLDARLGLPVWPRRTFGQSGANDAFAAAATVLVVLYVSFVRDFADLGNSPSFTRYGLMCLGVTLSLWLIGVVVAATFGLERSGVVELLIVGSLAGSGVPLVDWFVGSIWRYVEPIGQALRVDQPVWGHHGFVTLLAATVTGATAARLLHAGGVPRKLRPWDLFLLFALLALVQGALAFRGVSAIYLIAVAGFAAWLAGWRLHLSYADDEFVLRARRSPLLGLAQEQSGRSALACDES